MMPKPKRIDIEKLVDSLATISNVIWERLHCMECNQCEPCGPVFMKSLNVLRKAGTISRQAARKRRSGASR
jgi:hypothetical protein